MYEEQGKAAAELVLQVLRDWRGHKYVPSREDLSARCHVDDRVLRAAIAELRRQGYLIVADEEGGYRFATGWNDVERFLASMKSRIVALREVVTAMETRAAAEFGPAPVAEQMALF
jgi:DNA-binding GntR family transcriptional regulator